MPDTKRINNDCDIKADTTIPYFIEFEKDGKKSHFDLKDGKWQFWGELTIDKSAEILFERLAVHIDEYIKENFIMENGKLKKVI